MEKEIWKDIEGYEGMYQVSNLGRVKSLPRVITRNNGTILTCKERILKPGLNGYGYYVVSLSKQGKCKTHKLHQLVAKAFIPNPHIKSQVNHINGIKTDNRVFNLEWATAKENVKHAVDTGLRDTKGSKNYKSKLTEEQVLEIRSSNLSQKELGKIYGVSQRLINYIKNRKTWNHI